MLTLIPKPVFILLSFLLVLGLYYPSLNGGPIWDDFHFIFSNTVVTSEYSYWSILKDYTWPISMGAEKLLYSFWENEYFNYHLLNLLLHFFNSYLLLKMAKKLELPFPRFIFFLFLLHPSNVISVSWMVQLKTILCFTFCITSFFFFIKALEDKRYYALSWLSFALSILSKSASLPALLIFAYFSYQKKGKQQLLWLLPFLMISSYSTYKILSSEVTTAASIQIKSTKFVAVDDESGKVPQVLPDNKIDETAPLTKLTNILKTSHYYFWQVILPIESYPVKGEGSKVIGLTEIFHFIFLLILIYLNWRTFSGMCLIFGYLMLSPFLGLIAAPYMTLTWVSEQHLYLALPFFICFWMSLLAKWKFKYADGLPILLMIFLSVQTFRATPYYENDIIFYTKSLEADPQNIPIAYNLAVAHLKKNDFESAKAVTEKIIATGDMILEVSESKYYPYITKLHKEIVKITSKEP